MRIFFDFEFDNYEGRYFPISIGAVREDGCEFHARFQFELRKCSNWVLRNVIPQLKGVPECSLATIRENLCDMACGEPEFWANYGAYDWFLMCELFDGLMSLPKGWPSYYNELQMLRRMKGKEEPPDLPQNAHNALADAHWNKRLYEWCMS